MHRNGLGVPVRRERQGESPDTPEQPRMHSLSVRSRLWLNSLKNMGFFAQKVHHTSLCGLIPCSAINKILYPTTHQGLIDGNTCRIQNLDIVATAIYIRPNAYSSCGENEKGLSSEEEWWWWWQWGTSLEFCSAGQCQAFSTVDYKGERFHRLKQELVETLHYYYHNCYFSSIRWTGLGSPGLNQAWIWLPQPGFVNGIRPGSGYHSLITSFSSFFTLTGCVRLRFSHIRCQWYLSILLRTSIRSSPPWGVDPGYQCSLLLIIG